MTQVTVEEARDQWTDLIRKIGQGEEVTILQDERPIAVMSPILPFQRQARRGSAKHLIHSMSDDFDAPLNDFKEYME